MNEALSPGTTVQIAQNHPTDQAVVAALMKRYKDAFLVARSIVSIGKIVRIAGIVIGGIAAIVVCGLMSKPVAPGAQADSVAARFALGVLVGIGVAVPLFVLGTLISAQGQILKATLDTAVNSSPFLKDEERAQIMPLR
jgi:hypothetical protein